MRNNNSWISFFGFILAVTFWSCEETGNFYSNSQNIHNGWRVKDTITFNFEKKKQTNSKYNIYFVLRNNNEYPYRNIYLLTDIKNPKGISYKDTLEYQLAYANGEWIGDGMGAIKQNKLIYKENYPLKDSGVYEFKIIHGMREANLKGIEGISLLIDEIKDDNKK